MQENYSQAIVIDSGNESDYQGRFKAFFSNQASSGKSFIVKTKNDLKIIASRPIGRELLELLEKRHQGIGTKAPGKQVFIKNGHGTLTKGDYNTDASPEIKQNRFVNKKSFGGMPIEVAGDGTSTTVRYNPQQDYTKLLVLKTPSFVALAHELIHALHFLSGTMSSDMGYDAKTEKYRAVLIEEALTVGAGSYAGTRISENAIRQEHGLPLRSYYNTPGDCVIDRQGQQRPRVAPLGSVSKELLQGAQEWIQDHPANRSRSRTVWER